jgi:hypothetical protein
MEQREPDPRQLFTLRLMVKALPRAAGWQSGRAMFPSRLRAFLSPNRLAALASFLPVAAAWPAEKSPLSESFIAPTRVVWKSPIGGRARGQSSQSQIGTGGAEGTDAAVHP